jgi:hypothetical protein
MSKKKRWKNNVVRDELRRYIKEGYSLYLKGYSYIQLAELLNNNSEVPYDDFNDEMIRSFCKRSSEFMSIKRGDVKEKGNEVEIDYKQNNVALTVKSLNCLTLEDVLEIGKVDLDIWEVERHILNSWEVTMGKDKTGTGEPETFTNWQVKVWLKRKISLFDYDSFKIELLDEIKAKSKRVSKYSYRSVKSNDKNLFMMSLNDLHLGRMAWEKECGHNYNVKIAVKNFKKSFDSQLIHAQPYNVDQILFIVGNDLFNYDYHSPFPHTERGTPQESDGRWQKIFQIGRTLVVDAIDKLSTLAHVHVMVVPGNHDPQQIFYLGEVLDTLYHKNENVFVDNSPPRRKYYEYGNNLIGASHGMREKAHDLLAVMVAEAGKEIGRTKYRYFYMGHLHHEVSKKRIVGEKFTGLKTPVMVNEDYKGLIIDYLPNLARRHDYEVEHAYVGTIRSSKCAIHNSQKGRIVTFSHNL